MQRGPRLPRIIASALTLAACDDSDRFTVPDVTDGTVAEAEESLAVAGFQAERDISCKNPRFPDANLPVEAQYPSAGGQLIGDADSTVVTLSADCDKRGNSRRLYRPGP